MNRGVTVGLFGILIFLALFEVKINPNWHEDVGGKLAMFFTMFILEFILRLVFKRKVLFTWI